MGSMNFYIHYDLAITPPNCVSKLLFYPMRNYRAVAMIS